jgi:hypothetical protein
MDKSEQDGVREELAEQLEYFFASSHADKPIVYESDLSRECHCGKYTKIVHEMG